MMLVDAGPLVALASRNDPNHEKCVEIAIAERGPLLTTWPVVTEAVWVGRRWPQFNRLLGALFSQGVIHIYAMRHEPLLWMFEFMVRYESIKPDLADASLMYVADSANLDTIFTLDRRDFTVYRTSKNRALKIVP